jgi:hypothetical protein
LKNKEFQVLCLKNCCLRKTSTTTSGEEELNTSSEMKVFRDPKIVTYLSDDAECIQMCAIQYKLRGRSIGELCEHNANVASSVGRPTVIYFA